MNIAPRRKTILVGVPLAVAAVAFVVWLSLGFPVGKEDAGSPVAVGDNSASTLRGAVTEKDTDGDGLRDWEETLWKTDSNNPDTDGDGTNDGDEVKVGRDPAKAGPDDELTSASTSARDGGSNAPLSDTDKFSRNFFSAYLALKETDGQLDQAERDALLESALLETATTYERPTSYSTNDLTTKSDNSADSLRGYANEVAEIIFANIPSEETNEVLILKQALDQDDPDIIARLDPVAENYRSMQTGLANVAVPSSMATEHVRLTNSVAALVEMIEGVRVVFHDPLRALQHLGRYEQISADFINALLAINTGLTEAQATFSTGDSWHALTNFGN